MNKEYAIVLYQIETTEGYKWCAECPDLNGLCGGGDTIKEALNELQENKQFWIDTATQINMKIPNPTFYYD